MYSMLVERNKYDVLKVYSNPSTIESKSLFQGGLDSGIDIGKFTLDTSQAGNVT